MLGPGLSSGDIVYCHNVQMVRGLQQSGLLAELLCARPAPEQSLRGRSFLACLLHTVPLPPPPPPPLPHRPPPTVIADKC